MWVVIWENKLVELHLQYILLIYKHWQFKTNNKDVSNYVYRQDQYNKYQGLKNDYTEHYNKNNLNFYNVNNINNLIGNVFVISLLLLSQNYKKESIVSTYSQL